MISNLDKLLCTHTSRFGNDMFQRPDSLRWNWFPITGVVVVRGCCLSWPGLLEPQYWPLCGGLCEFSYWVIITLRELVYRTDWRIILRLRQHKNIQSRSLVGCFRCFEFLCHCFLHCWSHRTHTDVPSCIWRVKCEQRHPPLFFLLLLLFVKETFTVPFDVCASECLTWNTTSHFHHHVCMQQLYGQLHVHRDQIMSPPPIYWNKRGMLKLIRGDVHGTVICEIMCIEATMWKYITLSTIRLWVVWFHVFPNLTALTPQQYTHHMMNCCRCGEKEDL